jgi:putative transposase
MSFIDNVADAHDFAAGPVLWVHLQRLANPSRRELDDAVLLEQIVKIRAAHEFATTYGSPRVWLELRRQGCGLDEGGGAAHAHGLQGAHLRRAWKGGSTRQNPHHTAAPDLVQRDFRATAQSAVGGRSDPAGHR